ncbi:GPW/gp25 family protein [Acrocarpospora macrocephala]|uniref:IraD/Gp25-like domain-containing protein n=1 Tax=Acrocarpospora macrocephala TaxID=150177 RepID=A0A5M3WUS0_9ACTN|nr:GPW/gp25 family protein [Acrocarpospora macrocephala]GES11942.1 hypothetical protein Amac_055390 [Acrocarpospora macrocephala]
MNIAFPFHPDERRRTALAGPDDHVRQLVEQLVFTSPGERVNRPDFGTGLRQLVFAPNSAELASALQFLVQGALQQHLAHLIEVRSVTVEATDAQLVVEVSYVAAGTERQAEVRLEVAR